VHSLTFRPDRASDAPTIAALHADSWRRHYRGSYADTFLDGDVLADRLRVWGERLRQPASDASTVIAEADGRVVGFVHTVLDADPTWGALLDNLHIVSGYQRMGIGACLMGHSAKFVVRQRPQESLYLWVHETNDGAQAFYEAMGGRCTESAPIPDVGGVPGRLNGAPVKLRYVWSDPCVIASLTEGGAGKAAPFGAV
jgi:ribosomal protein S18 acetylase RimI-like enzyme